MILHTVTLSSLLTAEIARRLRVATALIGLPDHSAIGTLDQIAEITGRIVALKALRAFPAAERREHAIRLLAESSRRMTLTGAALSAARAEQEVYADAVSGLISLV